MDVGLRRIHQSRGFNEATAFAVDQRALPVDAAVIPITLQ